MFESFDTLVEKNFGRSTPAGTNREYTRFWSGPSKYPRFHNRSRVIPAIAVGEVSRETFTKVEDTARVSTRVFADKEVSDVVIE